MRRRPGELVPIEKQILAVALQRRRDGGDAIHGFALAKELSAGDGVSSLVGHGTLYKALGRLEKAGLLHSWWEDAETAATESRPRRRLYSLTASGAAAVAGAENLGSAVIRPQTAQA